MEATGQYWKPIWYVLEERGFELLLVNARHVKILPGRKTDVGRRGVARRAARARPAALELRAPAGDPRAAGPDPLPQAAHPGAHAPSASGSKRRSRTPGSSSTRSRRTCWACRAGRCCGRWSPANVIPRSSPRWPRARCVRRSPLLRQALHGRFHEHHHALLVGPGPGPHRASRRRDRRLDDRGRPGDRPFR